MKPDDVFEQELIEHYAKLGAVPGWRGHVRLRLDELKDFVDIRERVNQEIERKYAKPNEPQVQKHTDQLCRAAL